MMTETDILTELDFDLVVPCELRDHGTRHQGGEAKYIVRVTYWCCGRESKLKPICHPGYTRAVIKGLRCVYCRSAGTVDQFWNIVQVL